MCFQYDAVGVCVRGVGGGARISGKLVTATKDFNMSWTFIFIYEAWFFK